MCCTPAGYRRTDHAPAAGGLTWHSGSPLSQPCLPLVSAGMSPCIASDWCAPSPGPEHEQLQGAKCRRLKPAVLASEPCCVTSLVCRSLAPYEWEPNLCRGESGRGELCTYIGRPHSTFGSRSRGRCGVPLTQRHPTGHLPGAKWPPSRRGHADPLECGGGWASGVAAPRPARRAPARPGRPSLRRRSLSRPAMLVRIRIRPESRRPAGPLPRSDSDRRASQDLDLRPSPQCGPRFVQLRRP